LVVDNTCELRRPAIVRKHIKVTCATQSTYSQGKFQKHKMTFIAADVVILTDAECTEHRLQSNPRDATQQSVEMCTRIVLRSSRTHVRL
jgi:hypothetical protein